MATHARLAPLLLSLLLLCGGASAADWYVDAASGSDANAGTSPAAAWRTITHAIQTVPAPGAGETHVVHVAPGIYDVAHGEVFGWPMRTGVEIVGDQGSGSVTIDSAGGSVMGGFVGTGGGSAHAVVRGVTLRNIGYGFHMLVIAPGGLSISLEDVVIENAAANPIYGEIYYPQIFTGGSIGATLDDVRIDGATGGIVMNDWMAHGGISLVARDCELRGIAGDAIDYVRGSSSSGTLTLERCRIVDNVGSAVKISQSSGCCTTARIEDSLIARNGGDAIRGEAPGASAGGATVRRTTIVENAGAGARVITPAGFSISLENTVVYGNGDDVDDPYGRVFASWCDIGDGDFAGVDGNFSADPLFRDAPNGDWRLAWQSPCVDAGDPEASPGALDLAGTVRHVDGDLDTQERLDLGAFEFRPLDAAGVAQVGQPLVLEQWGRTGGSAILYLGRNGPEPVPLVTPFGDFDLDPTAFRDLGPGPTASGPPALRVIPIPADPVYAGLTFTFQARARSGLAPQGSAYTNPVTVTIAP